MGLLYLVHLQSYITRNSKDNFPMAKVEKYNSDEVRIIQSSQVRPAFNSFSLIAFKSGLKPSILDG